MISRVSFFLVFAAIAAVVLPVASAQAQYATAYEPPQHFPYVGPTNAPRAAPAMRKPYAKQPHARRRAAPIHHYRSVRCTHDCIRVRRAAHSRDHSAAGPIRHAERAVEAKHAVVGKLRAARAKPIVIETRHVVGVPSRAIERRHSLGATPASVRGKRVAKIDNPAPRARSERGKKQDRVIHADAEVTILGPDRMIIRLSRKKSRGTESSARAD